MARFKSPRGGRKRSSCGDKNRIDSDLNNCCCGYLEIVSSVGDSRTRHFDRCAKTVWYGAGVNSEHVNYCGQHPEHAFDCDIAVYDVDFAAETFKQYRRSVATGENLELMWEAPMGIFADHDAPWGRNWPAFGGEILLPWTPHRVQAFQSYNDSFVFYTTVSQPGAVFHLIQLRAFTGSIQEEFVISEIGINTDIGGMIIRDFAWLRDSMLVWLTVHGPVGSSVEPDRPTSIQKLLPNNIEAVYNNVPLGYFGLSGELCEDVGGDALVRDRYLRPSFSRTGSPFSLSSRLSQPIESPVPKTIVGLGTPAHCSWPSRSIQLPTDRGFTSNYCRHIYHVPQQTGFPRDTFIRYSRDADTTEILPIFGATSTDWQHVVADTHALPSGGQVSDGCEEPCESGGTASGGQCCLLPFTNGQSAVRIDVGAEFRGCFEGSPISPNGECELTDEQLAAPFPFDWACYGIRADVVNQSTCPDDRISELSITFGCSNQFGDPIFLTPCWESPVVIIEPNRWALEQGYQIQPDSCCHVISVQAKTVAGCSNVVVFEPSELNGASFCE